jgi:hypothetical protein
MGAGSKETMDGGEQASEESVVLCGGDSAQTK